jgi:hypothetical protein
MLLHPRTSLSLAFPWMVEIYCRTFSFPEELRLAAYPFAVEKLKKDKCIEEEEVEEGLLVTFCTIRCVTF